MAEYRRNFLRFNPDSLDVAVAGLNEQYFAVYDSSTDQFTGDIAGLILDQSFKGCSVIFVNREESEDFFALGFKCILQVGKLPPLPAEVKWRENLPSRLVKVGFEFLK